MRSPPRWICFTKSRAQAKRLKPGQRVSVSLPLRGEEESLVVPWAAILHDIHGNTWVYENIAPQTFTRRRVQVARIVGSRCRAGQRPEAGHQGGHRRRGGAVRHRVRRRQVAGKAAHALRHCLHRRCASACSSSRWPRSLIVFGIRTVRHAPLDVFPEFAPPLVEIQTEAPGLSTEEVDALVTVPLENALNGLPFLKTIRSKSVLGLSSVVMIFQDGADVLRARQLVQERLALAQSRLPGGGQTARADGAVFVAEPRAEDRRVVRKRFRRWN